MYYLAAPWLSLCVQCPFAIARPISGSSPASVLVKNVTGQVVSWRVNGTMIGGFLTAAHNLQATATSL